MFNFLKNYNREDFCNFLSDFLPNDYLFINKRLKLNDSFKFFENATLLGEVSSLEDIKIIEIKHISTDKSRITISKEIFRLLSFFSYSKALVVIFNDNENEYRFSLITSKIEWVDDKKVKKKFSNPKRLSFLLGPHAKIHTPTKQLIRLGKVKDINDLNQRFDIEIINNEFFDDYKNLYLYLKKYLDEDQIFFDFAKKIKLETSLFAKKLLGQIIFCYFLQKKGWLGVNPNKSFGTGDRNFLRNKFNEYNIKKKNFFNDFLEFFFYQGLNNQNDNDYVKTLNLKVPYLGGGLFEYYSGYNWEKEILNIPNKTFSNKDKTGILDIFDLYNFTVDESENADVEISIDPEMLGRVFENLLDENIRKEGGAFYTPRVIVNYMTEESIFLHLINKLNNLIEQDELSAFIKEKNLEIPLSKNILSNARFLDNLLSNIKICDPAVGSGAFAISMMNLIVSLRLKLKDHVNRKYKNTSYYFKRLFIQNNFYGVDIDDSAVEITKLRLWLSLIVDEVDFNNTEPLPNLEFKIIQGNSLIETYDDINLGSKIFDTNKQNDLETLASGNILEEKIKLLAELQNKFLTTISYLKKQEIKTNISDTMIDIFKFIVFSKSQKKELSVEELKKKISPTFKKNFFPWGIFFADVFYNNDGFDIVIANPPYINTKEISKFDWKKDLQNNFGFVDDLYNHFTFLATYIAKDEGIISFITSDTFMTLQTKENMRNLIFKYDLIKFITTSKAFKPMVDTSIFFLQKKISNKDIMINYINLRDAKIDLEVSENRKKIHRTWENLLSPIFSNINEKNVYDINRSIYKENINSVIFTPTEKNLKIYKKLIPNLKKIYLNYWSTIKTSKKISQNQKIINHYNENLKEKDLTLMGLITQGGVGLQTGDNGSFVGCLEGSKEAERIIEQRPKKLFDVLKKKKKNFLKDFKEFNDIDTLKKMSDYLGKIGEEKIQSIFLKLKKKYGRDIFGQGFLFTIVFKNQIFDIDKLSDLEKTKGINHNEKIYVKYDKGDKDGNRWFFETPYYLKWDTKTVRWFNENSGRSQIGMPVVRNKQFYFKEGFCWSDVHTTYLKSRFKEKSVHDVLSMSLSSINEKIDNKYLVCLINSKLISEFQQNFLNNTSHFQINDARKLPVIVPTTHELKKFINIYDQAKKIKNNFIEGKITNQKHQNQLEDIQNELDEEVKKIYNL